MKERVRRELELVERRFGEIEVDPNLDWFVVRSVPLGQGWSKAATAVLVLLPGGYPSTPPDNFYTDADLKLATGSCPGSTSPNQTAAGRTCLQFSYHVEASDWHPDPQPEHGHNLLTFLEGVTRRLDEAN